MQARYIAPFIAFAASALAAGATSAADNEAESCASG